MASDPDPTDAVRSFWADLIAKAPDSLQKVPDDDLVAHVWACWLKNLADWRSLAPTDITLEMALSVVEPTLEMDTPNVAMAGQEKVLKAIASGNVTGAAKMIRELLWGGAANLRMRNQFATARRKQSERASLPRGNELTLLIRQIVKKRPGISEPELRTLLEKLSLQGHPVLNHITDGIIYWTSRKVPRDRKTNVSALRSILSREKSKIALSR